MPINVDGPWGDDFRGDLDAALRLRAILLTNAEGGRDAQLDQEYKAIRRAILEDDRHASVAPPMLRHNRDLHEMWATFKSFSGQWEPRRKMVREQFEALLDSAERYDMEQDRKHQPPDQFPSLGQSTSASGWTGTKSRRQRVEEVRGLLPVAQAAVDQLIVTLETPNPNGAPLLDDHEEAISNLRGLHAALGVLLSAAERGVLEDEWGDGLAAEAARYAKRAARALRDDPVPYAASGLLLGLMSAVGFPGIGGYLSGVALNIRKHSQTQQ